MNFLCVLYGKNQIAFHTPELYQISLPLSKEPWLHKVTGSGNPFSSFSSVDFPRLFATL
jgi:hypothetical protein